MRRRPLSRTRLGLAVALLAAALAGTAVATAGTNGTNGTNGTDNSPRALELPSPARYTAELDLECFQTSPYTPPPLPAPIELSHLNPEMTQLARWQIRELGPRTQLCSPVAKNGRIPPAGVLEWIREVDLACYRIEGPNLGLPLTLQHLNPQLTNLPRREVVLMTPETLCVPVLKNTQQPPPEVLEMNKYIDLVCYRETPQVPMNRQLTLTQLNPVLSHIPPTTVQVTPNRQLCVPVRKNNQQIPERVLRVLRYIDLEKWQIAAPPMAPTALRLRHINPLFEDVLPPEQAVLQARVALALPVAKNGKLPPTS
jgi:hypothetical protein